MTTTTIERLPVAGEDFEFWAYDNYDSKGHRGLGEVFLFRYSWDADCKLPQWAHRSPKGLLVPISNSTNRKIAPPMPQKDPKKCGCRAGFHNCTQCGQPYWIELHGCAAGYCTYCYHQG